MPTMTLLAMTQDILSDMNSDNVNSINDTVESLQVAQIIQQTFYEILTEGEWPHLGQLMALNSSGSSSYPTHMKLPTDTRRIEWIKYNKKKSTDTKNKYEDVEYKEVLDFVELCNQRDSSNTTKFQEITDYSGVKLVVEKDKAPSYWTSFDGEYIVFDSYDSTVDSILQTSKIQVYAYREPSLTLADSSIPDLPSKAFPYLLAEAKSVCFNTIKQFPNQKEEQRATRGRRRLSQDRWRYGDGINYPDYGRK